MNKPADARLAACHILVRILQRDGSLATHLNDELRKTMGQQSALVQEFCYGVCRYFHQLQAITSTLLEKPLRKRDEDVQCLLLLGLYQLYFMKTPAHAAVNETVATCSALNKEWARSLVNAVLREAQRKRESLMEACSKDYSCLYSHPQWLLDCFKQDWPQDYRELMQANNSRASMTLRVNLQHTTRALYCERLEQAGISARPGTLAATAVYLNEPMAVLQLPGFAEGDVSVQDEASQLIPELLPLAPGLRVLDACAAPGGKTCALLEQQNKLDVLALDNDARRLQRMQDNLQRCRLVATLECQDFLVWAPTHAGQFDLILLDVPCSATGVIRRHPDIKLLRTPEEIAVLMATQAAMLRAAWPLLPIGGNLLYSTCSTLQSENARQVAAFLQEQPDAKALPLQIAAAKACQVGSQLLPQQGAFDGFYYALLQKC